jgi:hypothetical protein
MRVMNAIAVSGTSSRVARRCHAATPMPASPAGIGASRLPPNRGSADRLVRRRSEA